MRNSDTEVVTVRRLVPSAFLTGMNKPELLGSVPSVLTASAMDRSQPIKARTVGRAMVISSICIILGGFLLRAVIIAGGQII